MKIVMVHNRYAAGLPSGENLVIDDEISLLRDQGVEVVPFLADSSDIPSFGMLEKAELLTRPIHSPRSVAQFRKLVEREQPDLVHVHNVYPLISPSVVRAAKQMGLPVAMSLHNYRLVCSSGLFFRSGGPCYDCVGHNFPYPAVLHGCYRGSRPESAIIAASLAAHRTTWHEVDAFFVLHGHHAEFVRSFGVPEDRIVSKANPVEGPAVYEPSTGDGFLYAGRLEVAKGTQVLLDAWERSGLGLSTTLTIIGDGPLRGHVERRAAHLRNVHYLGYLDRPDVFRAIHDAAYVVLPSLSMEGFPLLMVEGFARGRPAIVHDVGGLPSLVGNDKGWVSAPDVHSLASTMRVALDTPAGEARARQAACRAYYEERCRPDRVAHTLIAAYERLIAGLPVNATPSPQVAAEA